MELALTNIVNVSASATPRGIGAYNTSNVALFTDEQFDPDLFGDDGFKIYLEPTEVGTDFGTDSNTFAMANAVFSQQPNILAGNGYLVVIPFVVEVQTVGFSATPAAGHFELNFNGQGPTAAIQWNDTAAMVQTKLRALAGLEGCVVSGSITLSPGLTVTMYGFPGNAPLMTVTNDTLATGGSTPVTVTPAQATAGETFAAAITRTKDLVQYFGILETAIPVQADVLAAAAVIQPLNKMGMFVSYTEADVEAGGTLDLLTTGGFTKSRGLYYGGSTSGLTNLQLLAEALVMAASYAGRGFSTNFEGSNTTETMHLKDLIGVQPDSTMTQTILNKCETAGVDVYASFQGVPKVFTSGANSFFDQIYNLQWFVGALQVAGFNYLAQSSTKIPQTEDGMDGLKGAYRKICEQAVTNEYSAPGAWNSATTFGNQQNFLQNILQRGYYIYSGPIAQQSQTARDGRQAPLVQIALKEAGAIHSSQVIVYVNA